MGYVCIGFIFLGWYIVGLIFFGIGGIFVNPYKGSYHGKTI